MNIRGELRPADRERIWKQTARPKLKRQYEAQGLTFCLKCGNTNALSFGHRYKRRDIHDLIELGIAALLCTMKADCSEGCHQEIEHSDTMFEQITELIQMYFPTLLDIPSAAR